MLTIVLVVVFATVCWGFLQVLMRASTYHRYFLLCMPFLIGLGMLAAYLMRTWFPRDIGLFWIIYAVWLVPNIKMNWDPRQVENNLLYQADPRPEVRAFIELSLRLTKVFYALSHLTFATAYLLSFYLLFTN